MYCQHFLLVHAAILFGNVSLVAPPPSAPRSPALSFEEVSNPGLEIPGLEIPGHEPAAHGDDSRDHSGRGDLIPRDWAVLEGRRPESAEYASWAKDNPKVSKDEDGSMTITAPNKVVIQYAKNDEGNFINIKMAPEKEEDAKVEEDAKAKALLGGMEINIQSGKVTVTSPWATLKRERKDDEDRFSIEGQINDGAAFISLFPTDRGRTALRNDHETHLGLLEEERISEGFSTLEGTRRIVYSNAKYKGPSVSHYPGLLVADNGHPNDGKRVMYLKWDGHFVIDSGKTRIRFGKDDSRKDFGPDSSGSDPFDSHFIGIEQRKDFEGSDWVSKLEKLEDRRLIFHRNPEDARQFGKLIKW